MSLPALLHPPRSDRQTTHTAPSPLPQLLHTPAGFALLELQGTINVTADPSTSGPDSAAPVVVPVGRLDFPEHRPGDGAGEGVWMKRVYLYVGPNQRLGGEVKKLARPLAVIRRRRREDDDAAGALGEDGAHADELEVVEIVRYKLVFSHRPEPVGSGGGAVAG